MIILSKSVLARFSIVFGMLAILCMHYGLAQANQQALDRIVAVVNDDVILQSELDAMIINIEQQLRRQNTNIPSSKVMQKQVLERLILEKLQLQLAERSGIRVDDNTLNRAVENIAAQNKLPLRQFRRVLEKDGFSFEKFRENVRNQVILTRLRQRHIDSQIVISAREIDDFLQKRSTQGNTKQQVRLGHILIALPEAAAPEQIQAAKAKAEQVLQQLRDGADFKQTAIAESDGQQALEGGDLGWRKAEEVPSIFANTVREMSVGDLSELIRSPSGFHIIKLLHQRGQEQRFVTQAKVRHILIRPNEIKSEQAVVEQLQLLAMRIQQGEDFANLARAYSEDTSSAQRGGSLEWVSPGDTVPQFEQVLSNIDINAISEPFETQYGWHILQVVERRERDSTDDYNRSQATEAIRQRKAEEAMALWLRRLRDEAYVDYRL